MVCDTRCADSDADGMCDDQDRCPNFDDRLIGTACDDKDATTENDKIQADCTCKGEAITLVVSDICGASYNIAAGAITVAGLDAPISSVQILSSEKYEEVYKCDNWTSLPCNPSETMPRMNFIS